MKKKFLITGPLFMGVLICMTSFNIFKSNSDKTIIIFKTESINMKENVDEVKIAKQTWMSKNLEVTTFSNGEIIEEAKDSKEWRKAGKEGRPAWCYYNFKEENGKIYGKIYNWYAVNDPRGLAPKGWHVPSNTEWATLVSYLGGELVAAPKIKSASGWAQNLNGDNSSGFNGLPGGYQNDVNGFFTNILVDGFWWTSTESNSKTAYAYNVSHNSSKVYKSDFKKLAGLYVRCVKD